jgi:hypothetical protein
VLFNRIGDDIFLQFVLQDLLIRLVNFDNFFNSPINVAGEQLSYFCIAHVITSTVSKDSRPIIVFRV